jgi:hypothetical protein
MKEASAHAHQFEPELCSGRGLERDKLLGHARRHARDRSGLAYKRGEKFVFDKCALGAVQRPGEPVGRVVDIDSRTVVYRKPVAHEGHAQPSSCRVRENERCVIRGRSRSWQLGDGTTAEGRRCFGVRCM